MKRFSMLMLRRPVSLRTASPKYKSSINADASVAMDGRAPFEGRLYARIIWFHAEPTTQDADNIVKPILDALKNVVFKDDSQVGECHVARIDISRPYTFLNKPEVFGQLSELLVRNENHIVFVEVGESPEQIVDFGVAQEEL